MNKIERIRRAIKDTTVIYDTDGVVANSGIPVMEKLNREWGTNYRISDHASWDWIYDQAKRMGYDHQEAMVFRNYWYDPELLREASPYRGLKFVVNFWHRLGTNQRFTTARFTDSRETTLDWYERHLSWAVERGRIYMREDDTSETGYELKARVAKLHRADVFFDDSGLTVGYLINQDLCPRLVDQPWNRDPKEFGHLNDFRVKGWFGMLTAIRRAVLIKATQLR